MRAGEEGSSKAGAREEAPVDQPSCLSAKTARLRGWARLRESGDLVQRLSHPAGPKTLKNALGCLSAKAAQLRGRARRRGPGRQSILRPRAQGSKASTNPQKPCPSRQGRGRSVVEGGGTRGKEENQDIRK
ncbi:hypothetical protein NDU88_005328 [Pleurodeles waltl]|uniref:Uncharacterized protein n=1 Tax=Pleurodeles waltl TaxID=8319 RepID=A0AAV7SLE6_PLEWA|nr:hypothetical protein NDU88_005328 [Pleurodeles waltl]